MALQDKDAAQQCLPSPCPPPAAPLPEYSPGGGDPRPLGGQGPRWPGQEAAQRPRVRGRDGPEPHRMNSEPGHRVRQDAGAQKT